MLSPKQREKQQERKGAIASLKAAYRRIFTTPFSKLSRKSPESKEVKLDPALKDLLDQLDHWHDVTRKEADEEISNPYRSAAYLQRAKAYDNVRLYIRDKLS